MAENEQLAIPDFAEKIRDRIKSEFMGMIPDETWDRLVKSCVYEFTEDHTVPDAYSNTRRHPRKAHAKAHIEKYLDEMVKQECAKRVKAWMEEVGNEKLQEIVKEQLVELAPKIIAKMIESTASRIADNMGFTMAEQIRQSMSQ